MCALVAVSTIKVILNANSFSKRILTRNVLAHRNYLTNNLMTRSERNFSYYFRNWQNFLASLISKNSYHHSICTFVYQCHTMQPSLLWLGVHLDLAVVLVHLCRRMTQRVSPLPALSWIEARRPLFQPHPSFNIKNQQTLTIINFIILFSWSH